MNGLRIEKVGDFESVPGICVGDDDEKNMFENRGETVAYWDIG